MNGQDETPNKSTLTSKKTDTSSPLQESSLELKKSKVLKNPLAHTAHTAGDCSNIEIDSGAGQVFSSNQRGTHLLKRMMLMNAHGTQNFKLPSHII